MHLLFWRRWILTPLFLLTLVACTMPTMPEVDITSASRDFTQRLRWLDLNGAAQHLAEEHQEAFLKLFRDDKELRLTDVRIVRIEPKGETATVSLEIEYHRYPSLALKVFPVEQEWTFTPGDRKAAGAWLITTPFPPLP